MQIPISKLTKLIKSIPQCSAATAVPLLLYSIFILIVLTISFPLKSHGNILPASAMQQLKNNFVIDELNELSDDEQKLLQKANELENVKNKSEILRKAFRQADWNDDSLLTLQELAKFINRRICDHIEGAIRSNPIDFSEIDRAPRNGLVTWDEYYSHFLKTRGYNDEFIKHVDRERHTQLDRKSKEQIVKDKLMWNEAARTDSYSLTLDEFLAFRHPEASAANMLSLVDDLLRQFDEDGDEHLTIDEFSEVIADNLDDKWRMYMIEKTIFQRQEEFKRLIDKNHDGVADRSELLTYVNPKHPRHALQEAATLFNLADRNKDHRLTLREMERAANIFMASRMIDSSQTFHDDF